MLLLLLLKITIFHSYVFDVIAVLSTDADAVCMCSGRLPTFTSDLVL